MPSTNPLTNLPSTSPTAFLSTSSQPRRLLAGKNTPLPTASAVSYATVPVRGEGKEVLLIAGRDPEARARVRFDSGAVVGGGGFLERARAAFGGVVGEGGVDVEWGEGKADSGGRKREGKGKKPVKEEEKEENEEEEEEKGGRKGEEDGRRKKKGELKKPDEGRRRKRLRRGV